MSRVRVSFPSRLVLPVGLVAFLALGWPVLSPALSFLLSGICPQRPSHSFYIGSEPMPLEARMLGIYGGFTIAFACLMAFRDRVQIRGLPRSFFSVIPLGLLVTGLDGGNAFLSDMGMPHPYQPMNQLRFLTGAMAGVSVGALSLPFIGLLAAAPARGEPAGMKPLLAWLLALEAAFVAFVLSGLAPLTILAQAIASAGILGLFWVTNGICLGWTLRHLRPPIRLDAVLPLALLLAVAELALLALLRTWLQQQLGVVWL